MQITIETPQNTPSWLKRRIAPSESLKLGSEKLAMPHGKQLHVASVHPDKNGHVLVTLGSTLTAILQGFNYEWDQGYLYAPHIKGLSTIAQAASQKSLPGSPSGQPYTLHDAPYFQQRNNKDWGDDGSASSLRYGGVQCGLTSVAMLIATVWDKSKVAKLAIEAGGQFEDWVAGQFKRLGAQSISMEGHVAVLRDLGFPAECARDYSVSQLMKFLENGPAVLGFEYKSSGHFGTAIGFNPGGRQAIKKDFDIGAIGSKKPQSQNIGGPGILYHDPFGDRDWSGSGNNWHSIAETIESDDGALNFADMSVMQNFWASSSDGWAVVLTKPMIATPAIKIVAPPESLPTKPETAPTIEILQQTWLKRSPVQSSALQGDQKRLVEAGKMTAIVIGAKDGHGRLKLHDGEWYLFNAHFRGQESAAGMVAYGVRSKFIVDSAKLRSAILSVRNPSVSAEEVEQFCSALEELAPRYTIENRTHLIHFLAQVLHESGGLMYLEELADGEDYTDRDDLGNCDAAAITIALAEGQSTGAFYKGHGLIQLTGYTNHADYAKASGFDAVQRPTELAKYPHALGSALWFWSSRGPSLSDDADGGLNEATVIKITKVVNGGTNGLDDRLHYFHELCDRL